MIRKVKLSDRRNYLTYYRIFGKSIFRLPPVQHFQLHRSSAIEFIDARRKREVKFPDQQRTFARVPPDRLVRRRTVRRPKFDVLLLRAHARERAQRSSTSNF